MALALVCLGCSKDDGKIDVIFDTDANNEIDDQHAIAYLLLSDDVFNTLGLTTNTTRNGGDIKLQTLEARKPASIEVCTLLYNPGRQLIDLPVKYYGFEVDRSWLVGYGMDQCDYGRNLPFIAEIEH